MASRKDVFLVLEYLTFVVLVVLDLKSLPLVVVDLKGLPLVVLHILGGHGRSKVPDHPVDSLREDLLTFLCLGRLVEVLDDLLWL